MKVIHFDGWTPLQRWERDVADGATLSVIVQRVCEGEALKGICKSRGWPYSLVAQWVAVDPGRAIAVIGALALRQAELRAADRKRAMCPECAKVGII